MSDYWGFDNQPTTQPEEAAQPVAEEAAQPVVEEATPRRKRKRRSKVTHTRASVTAVLERYRALEGASQAERDLTARVWGVDADLDDLVVATLTARPTQAAALADLVTVLDADESDRPMAALGVAMGTGGPARLKAAYALAGGSTLPTNPVSAGRTVAEAAGEVEAPVRFVEALV